ncbi:Nucleolar pre-ribosomal-associated protein 1, partial [Mucuna pruriens]
MAEHAAVPTFQAKVSHEAKLKELLHRITSLEIKLCSDATKEFAKLLKSETGGDLLREYVRGSPKCSELLEAWKLREGKQGMHYVFDLISAILNHSEGKYNPSDAESVSIAKDLDKFARLLISERLNDIHKEVNSKEWKRQKAALSLASSIVRRGGSLASEVAKSFDFKLAEFSKLASAHRRRMPEAKVGLLRKSFVGFAMSFLEVGKPWLLRWVLQQREMYSGVLRGLGNDDDETVVFVLSVLRDRILIVESLVPPGLRSVLFGSATLGQLVEVCGREGGDVAEVAFGVLVRVCTDPCNGLMPDLKMRLRGNTKRVLDLMKKLRATEVEYHRDLLLAIVNAKASFGLSYLKEFPISAISVAAQLVSLVRNGLSKEFVNFRSNGLCLFDNMDLHSVVKCLFPRPFSRSLFNKGLPHVEPYVKHGTLRLLLELLKLLDSLFGSLNLNSSSSNPCMQHMMSIKDEIQNYVLLNLLSSLDASSEAHNSNLKRKACHHEHNSSRRKKLKMDTSEGGDIDIVVGGISSAPDIDLTVNSGTVDSEPGADALDDEEDLMSSIGEIWGVDLHSLDISTLKDVESYLLSKLLDALRFYRRALPFTLDNSFESFKGLLKSPLELTSHLQVSLLSLLVEYIEWCPDNEIPIRTPPMLYKYLQPFIKLLMFSPYNGTRDLAYRLALAAMFSTGYHGNKSPAKILEVDVLPSLTLFVISFLCDAVSTLGNNLVKYWSILKSHAHCLEGGKDFSPHFSPFIICVLEKCLKVIRPKSGSCSLPKKSMVLLYTCNTVKYLLQTQVNAELLSALVHADLTERLGDSYECDEVFPEWKPLKDLLDFVESILHQRNCCLFYKNEESVPPDSSLGSALGGVNRLLNSGSGHEIAETTIAFVSSIILESTDKILTNLPSRVIISCDLVGVPFSLLLSVLFLDYSVLLHSSKLWPVMFYAGLDMAISDLGSDSQNAAPVGTSDLTSYPDSLTCSQLLDAPEADAVAFSIFLKQAPFHVIFRATMCMNGPYPSKLSKIQELLLHKLSESINDCSLLPNLQLVLFWTHQIQLCYEVNPIVEIEQLLDLCVILVGNLLAQLLVPESDSDWSMNSPFSSSRYNIHEVIKTIFCHPCVLMSLSFSLGNCQNIENENIENDLNMLNVLFSEGFHKFGNPVLNILTMTLDHIWSLFGAHLCASKADNVANNFVKAFKGLQEKLFRDVRDRFELCIHTKDVMPLLPTLYALHTLHRFVSPFQLLELVDWMFSSVEVDDLPIKKSSLFVGCSLAADAFSALSIYFQQSTGNRIPYDLFWEMGEKNMKADIFEQIYIKVVDFSVSFEIDSADRCLLEAVNALYKQKHMQQETFHPLLLVMWKIIMITPLKMLSHCIYKTNVKKAKFLHILTELSSLHSLIFGHLFLGTVNRSLHHDIGVMDHTFDLTLSEDQFMLLIPASLSYLSFISKRLGDQSHKDFEHIPYFYSKILLKCFSQWKSFSLKDIFEEQYGELFPSSAQELLCLIDHSLLGKSVHMLKYHFALNGNSVKLKKRLNLFKSICPKFASHDDLMDCDSQVIDSYSLCQSLNIINRVVAKISLCKILLFHEDAGGDLKDVAVKMQSKLGTSRIRFANILVDIWQFIVKKFSFASDESRTAKGTNISLLYNHLEGFLLESILELAGEMQNDLIQLQSISFLEQLVKSALLYRFGDFTTMKTLRVILSQLNEGRLSYELYLQLLLAHSQFAPTLHSVHKLSGSLLKPVSTILKCLVIPSLDHCENDEKHIELTTKLSRGPLEILKLLWILLSIKARQTDSDYGNDIGINLKELHALLRHSYGATLNWVDLALYNLMQQIESMSGPWSQNVKLDSETIEEWYRSQHRDNFPIDPDICVSTVLYFPYDRSIPDELPSVNKIEPVTARKKVHSSHVEDRERYDPAFILRFSIHSLSKAYIEPVEFAGSGLLAIAFVSLSSPDHGIRRLAYGTLDKFKNALEKCKKRKDVMGLRLILNSVQNSIEVPWQRIPSVIALFAAEASCVLLDPSHDHYAAISTSLIHSSKLNMRVIPMFDNFFWSTSVNFKAERSWILRLVYAGLNSDDDAVIYIRNSILESLMSFYVSPLSDFDSKNLIIEVIKKSVKLHKVARHLVKRCSLFSWFSSLISVTRQRLDGDENKLFLKHVLVALKVSNSHSVCSSCWMPKSPPLQFDTLIMMELSTHPLELNQTTSSHRTYSNYQFTMHTPKEGKTINLSASKAVEFFFFTLRTPIIIQVVNDVISSGSIYKWLQNHGLEQLMELSSNLFNFLLHDVTLTNESVVLVNPFLQMITSTLKLSQKRKIYQPHFTLSVEGLYQMYQAGSVCNQATKSIKPELALEAILMNAPPVSIFLMNQGRLQSFLIWATTTALQSQSLRRPDSNDYQLFFRNNLREEFQENSVVLTFLRWLTASAIIGKLHNKTDNRDSGLAEAQNFESLHSLLVHVENVSGRRHDIDIGAEEILASTILYLQLRLGINHEVLPSVVCALCLLVFGASKFAVGRTDLLQEYDTLISSHSSRVRSFYQPWEDHSLELSDSQKMEEYHACLTLLVVISNVVGGKKLESSCLSPVDLEKSGLFQWERSLLRN